LDNADCLSQERSKKVRTSVTYVLCAILAIALLVGCSSSKSGTPADTVEASTDLTTRLTESFSDANSALGSITDVESAQSAVPQLENVEANVDEISKSAASLPSGAGGSLSEIVAAQVPPLKEAMDQAYAIPGVKDVIQPSMDSLLAKYAGF